MIKNPPTNVAGYDPTANTAGCEWDGEAAALAVEFFPEVLTHPDRSPGAAAGAPLHLEQWQRDYIATLYGWKRPDKTRRYQESAFFVPRKNGKTTLFAGVALYEMFAMGRQGAQFYSAATEKEQASLVFRIAAAMVRKSPTLSRFLECIDSTRRIVFKRAGSYYRAIPSEAASAHGFKPACVFFDELHTQTNRELFDALSTGFGSTVDPLFCVFSTAGWDRHSLCYQTWQRARRVRDTNGSDDPYFLPLIYEPSEGADWKSEDTWRACNPNLEKSVDLNFLRKECRKAIELPAYENTFRNLYLNEWTEQAVRAIAMDQWDRCGLGDGDRAMNPVEWRRHWRAALKGKQCVGALDLGSTGDLTALSLLFGHRPPFTVLPFFWVPRESAALRERRDRVPYAEWIKAGFVLPTEGTTTDYDKVRADINALASEFGIREITIDRLFQGAQLATQLAADGHEVTAFGQGFMSMAAPTKQVLELIANGGIRHGNNPVLRWNASNAATEQDSAGNLKFSKKKSTERIDGIVTLTMAVGRAIALGPPATSKPYSGSGTGVWG
jgi:phage terminase large subunit-like protein